MQHGATVKITYNKLYLEYCSSWIRNMDPRKKWRKDRKFV